MMSDTAPGLLLQTQDTQGAQNVTARPQMASLPIIASIFHFNFPIW